MKDMIETEMLTEAEGFARTHHFRLMIVRDGISVEKKRHAVECVRVVPWGVLEAAILNPLIAMMELMRAEFE